MSAPRCDSTEPIVFQAGQTGAILKWTYRDVLAGTIIDPSSITPFTGRLFTPSDVQVLPSNTATTTSATFTPVHDVSGAITGTAGAFYVIINFAAGAPTGQWYVELNYTYQSVASDMYLCLIVVAAGAIVDGGTAIGTAYTYSTPKDVQDLIQLPRRLDQNSTAAEEQIAKYILYAEGEFDQRTGTSYRVVTHDEEVQDFEALMQRYPDYGDVGTWLTSFRPIYLRGAKPLIFPDAAAGDLIEVYQGDETTAAPADPVGRWNNLLTTGTYGRNGDYWFDLDRGIIYIKKAFLIRRGSAVRLRYRAGKPITTITAPVDANSTMVPVVSTLRYQQRGTFRIGRNWFFHTGKTNTAFSGVAPMGNPSEVESYGVGSEVIEVPEDVRRLATMRAAALYLSNNRFLAQSGDSSGTTPPLSKLIDTWNAEWEAALSTTYAPIVSV